MSNSTDNIVYLAQAAKSEIATPPAADIGPLSDDEQHFVDTHRLLSRQDRDRIHRLLTRWLNSDEGKRR